MTKSFTEKTHGTIQSFDWPVKAPFVSTWIIQSQDIDHYGHTNNAAYVKQMEKVAWAHSNALGISIADYKLLNRGMVIKTHQIEYQHATYINDQIATATWISACDKKLRLTRNFQFINNKNLKVVLEAKTNYICICLSTGKPARMPALFIKIYGQDD